MLEALRRVSTLLDDLKRHREHEHDRDHKHTAARVEADEWRHALHAHTPWWTAFEPPSGNGTTRNPDILSRTQP
jgi:hypothetical protein